MQMMPVYLTVNMIKYHLWLYCWFYFCFCYANVNQDWGKLETSVLLFL